LMVCENQDRFDHVHCFFDAIPANDCGNVHGWLFGITCCWWWSETEVDSLTSTINLRSTNNSLTRIQRYATKTAIWYVFCNKNVLSFPKQDSLKYWRLKSNVNSHMSIQHVNIKVTILVFFRFVRRQMVSPKKVHVQTTWNFRLQKIAQAVIKLVSQKW
jgi:hypothetical protein